MTIYICLACSYLNIITELFVSVLCLLTCEIVIGGMTSYTLGTFFGPNWHIVCVLSILLCSKFLIAFFIAKWMMLFDCKRTRFFLLCHSS